MTLTRRRATSLAVAAAFYAALAFVLARYLRGTDWGALGALRIDWIYLVAALPLSLLPRFVQPYAWRVLIHGYGESAPAYAQLTRVYATSWLGRYIPGKVAWIGAKVVLGREYGLRTSTLLATSIAEALIQLATALALAFLLVALSGNVDALPEEARMLAMAALLGMTVLLSPPVFNMVATRVRAFRGGVATEDGRLSTRSLLAAVALYLFVHLASGLPIFLVVRSMFGEITATQIPALTAAFLFAGTIGTLAVFAPSGLGVREGLLLVLLGFLMPRHVALAAVVVLRLWSTAMDLVFYLVSLAWGRQQQRLANT